MENRPVPFHEISDVLFLFPGSVMFVSTLDGQFLAVYRDTGRVLWALKQDPVLRMTKDVSKGPIFLPDPRDGSLYTFGRRKNEKDLTKLPFTVRVKLLLLSHFSRKEVPYFSASSVGF